MSLTYGFYNSLNGDRKYDAKQMSKLFEGIIKDGVFMSIGTSLLVTKDVGMSVYVGSGRAWFNNTWTDNDAPMQLTLDPSNLLLSRIDAIVLEVNTTESIRTNTIKIVKGVNSSFPVKPTMIKNTLVNQYPLCYISVGLGVTEILQTNIENKIGTSACPFITGILETINTDSLLIQWEDEFNIWFDSIQDILDENVAGNLLNLINEKAEITKGTGTIPITGWVVNVGVNALKLDIPITGVLSSDWVDVTVDKEKHSVAGDAEINPTVVEYDGGITVYANIIPSGSITFKWKVVR